MFMTTLSLSLLGAFLIERDGQPLNGFATDKARALLAYLAIERDRPHRRENLAALLWPDQADGRARQNLRQALSHLKQALGSDEFLLVSPQDVQIHPQAHVYTDIGEFESLLKTCENHRHRDMPHCLPCLYRQERLLALYRGEFLAGFPSQNSETFEEWLVLTRERLHQAAMSAHGLLANLHERRGDLAIALQHARAQIALEPWREESHRQAMRLYAKSGERSQALAQYQACQRILHDELAATPTAETERLRTSIENGEISGRQHTTSQLKELPGSSPFIGRQREQDELAERIADPSMRLVTILGMGGLGKSRLAWQVAHAHVGLYRDGVYFVPLVTASDVPGAIATALGQTAPDAAERLPEILRKLDILLVLDNFEHLVETSECLSPLLDAAPGLMILVTSRERLRLREEWVYALDGLSYPGEKDELDIGRWDSLALFELRAAQVDSRFQLTRACLADISALCQLVEGHPLAIELAASASADQDCGELLSDVRQTFDALAPSLRNLPERHRSLRVVFEHSWNLLKPGEHVRLANLSVFVGGFSAEAAATVADISAKHLSELVAKSLVRRNGDGRYNLHESIRQFAAEKLDDAQTVREKHGEYYASFVEGLNGEASATALDALQMEQANLRAAWEWSAGINFDITASLLPGLSLLYSLRGPMTEGEALFEAVANLPTCPATLKTDIHLELARLYNAQARYDDAIALARSLPESARSLLAEGQAHSAQGECEAARPVLEKSLALARELGDKRVEADSLRELGNVANRLVEYDLAVPFYQQSLALTRELGDLRGESATLNNWASVEWDLGELDAARTHYEQALELYRQLGNRLGEAKALNNISNVLADQGNMSGSLAFCHQALEIHREMGNPRGQSAALNNLGATYFGMKEYDAARKSYQQALALYRESGNRQAEGETLANLSLLDCVQGRLGDGRKNARAAITLAEKAGDKVNQANAHYYLGRIELSAGQVDTAEQLLNHALILRQDVPHPGRIAEIQAELALAAFQQGDLSLARKRMSPVIAALDSLDGTDEPERIRELVKQVLEN